MTAALATAESEPAYAVPPPFTHQLETYLRTRDLPAFALFWEPGTGKTRTIIDTAAHLYRRGEITGVVVVAPPGVHRNWATDEIPKHIPIDVAVDCYVWHAARAASKREEFARETFAKHLGLAILCMTYDGICTPRGKEFAGRFMRARPCMLVADESAYIKTPSAQRTKVMLGAAKVARYRRALTGTPVANGPFDIYAQMKFLDEGFWRPHGLATYTAFKARFGVFKDEFFGARRVPKLVAYRDVERIHDMVAPLADRRTKTEVLPHLPPKLYQRMPYELTATQRRAYEQMVAELRVELGGGHEVTAPLAAVRLLRLQQICCGYLPERDGAPSSELRELMPVAENPRLAAFTEIATSLPHQAIVWCRFQRDVTNVVARLDKLGLTSCRYDGTVGQAEREDALARFHSGAAQFFVANPAAIGTGVTLTEAKTVVYYSSDFNYANRLQSEDRAHRIGQDSAVLYYDIVAEDTVDERVLRALRSKDVMASRVTGDTLRDWIS